MGLSHLKKSHFTKISWTQQPFCIKNEKKMDQNEGKMDQNEGKLDQCEGKMDQCEG